MHNVIRGFVALGLVAMAGLGAGRAKGAATAGKEVEYKRGDANFYVEADVRRAQPTAVILAESAVRVSGDSYFIVPKVKAPKVVYVEEMRDWVEPITPPDMPASLGVAPDAMAIKEPQGDVEVALPSVPGSFVMAQDGMVVPNGSVVKTGADGTAAVLFGGVASARLVPNSEAAVQMTVSAGSRSTEVDLTKGAVFSKVGTVVGMAQDYRVMTPTGGAVARGTDFVTVALPARTDVWIARGTVELDQHDGAKVGEMKSEGAGPLKMIRFPAMANPHATMMADAESMSVALNFIPLANQKIKALRAKMAGGAALTPNEDAYMKRMKEVPCLVKLTLVDAGRGMAAPQAVVPAPVEAASSAANPVMAPIPPPLPAPPVGPAPVATPAPAPGPTTMEAPAAPGGSPDAGAATDLKPLRAVVRVDGKVNFMGLTFEVPGFKEKLVEVMKATPEQPIIVRAGKTVDYEKVKAVMDICTEAQVKNLTVYASVPPAGGTGGGSGNLPGPGLIMHPAGGGGSNNSMTNAPAEAPKPGGSAP